jgi:hypothetical protein
MVDHILENAPRVMDVVHKQLLGQGLQYFMPAARISVVGQAREVDPVIVFHRSPPGTLEFDWLGNRYLVESGQPSLTDDQMRMVKSIGHVLSMRYQLAFDPALWAEGTHLFRGIPEDRYISAFLDGSHYRDTATAAGSPDRIAEAIEVLRLTALSTYENRRISTGVILFGSHPDVCHTLPLLPDGALRYSHDLTTTRSFHRLSDGLKTVALVNPEGLLVELVDVAEWAAPFRDLELPAPVATRYESHSRATLCGGHVCMILTANSEIKVFANGSQVFTFRDGRWRLASATDCFQLWTATVGNQLLAERLFTVALNLAEDRRGALFVILDDPARVHDLVSPDDLLGAHPSTPQTHVGRRFQYLLRDQSALRLSPSIIETVARIDGAIVLDPEANLLSFGAILQNSIHQAAAAGEGSRTAAAVAASQFGTVLKVSEDGMISSFRDGVCLWEI